MSNIAKGTWDSTLLFVMGGGVLVSFVSYQFIEGYNVVPACPPPVIPEPLLNEKDILQDGDQDDDQDDKTVATVDTATTAERRRSSRLSMASTTQRQRPSLCGCVPQLDKPLLAVLPDEEFHIPTNRTIDADLMVGSTCFGLGWSLVGLCPAPALFSAAVGIPQVLLLWWPAYYLGLEYGNYYKTSRTTGTAAAAVGTTKKHV